MIVYLCKNTINNKVYIGITTRTLKDRKYEHIYAALHIKNYNIVFYNSIRKYGVEAFEWEVLIKCDTIIELLDKEEYYISLYDSTNREKGYNMLSSSTFFKYKHTQEYKDNLSKIQLDTKLKYPSSNYLGVVFIKSSNRWSSRIRIDGKLTFISNSDSEMVAAVQHDLYVIENSLDRKLNFTSEELEKLLNLYNIEFKVKNKDKTSNYYGVSFNSKSNRWNSQVWLNGKPTHIGSYLNECDAAVSYNKYIISNKLNFKLNDVDILREIIQSKYLVKRGKYFGVTYKKSNKKYQALIRLNSKTKHIGYYSTEIEAAKAYDEFIITNNISKSINFPIKESFYYINS